MHHPVSQLWESPASARTTRPPSTAGSSCLVRRALERRRGTTPLPSLRAVAPVRPEAVGARMMPAADWEAMRDEEVQVLPKAPTRGAGSSEP